MKDVSKESKIIWLTKADPRSKFGGELIYTNGLIRSAARHTAKIHVIYYANVKVPSDTDLHQSNIVWHPVPYSAPSALGSLFSHLPYHSYRYSNQSFLDKTLEILAREQPNTIVIDSLAMGWIYRPMRPHISPSTKTVYLAHNHEGTVRLSAALGFEGNSVKRAGLIYDAIKAQRLEKRLGRGVSVISSITEHDAGLFRQDHGSSPRIIVAPPGYEPIPASLPPYSASRTVCIIGSFEWHAKQTNLLKFLDAAYASLHQQGVIVRVIGSMPEAFRFRLRSTFKELEVTGKVESIDDHARDCAMGLIIEELGGGFKLKALDYVFLGLPIAALAGSMTGMPLVANEDYLEGQTLRDLAAAICNCIGDIGRLREMRQRAYEKAGQIFSWEVSALALTTC